MFLIRTILVTILFPNFVIIILVTSTKYNKLTNFQKDCSYNSNGFPVQRLEKWKILKNILHIAITVQTMFKSLEQKLCIKYIHTLPRNNEQ